MPNIPSDPTRVPANANARRTESEPADSRPQQASTVLLEKSAAPALERSRFRSAATQNQYGAIGTASTDSTSGKLEETLAAVTNDKVVTAKEWKEKVTPVLSKPVQAGAEAERLLELYAGSVKLEAGAQKGLGEYLQKSGYPAKERPKAAEKEVWLERTREANVTAKDAHFEKLLQQTGQQGAKTVISVVDSGFDLDHVALEGKVHENAGEIAKNRKDDDGNGLVDDRRGYDFTMRRGDPDVDDDDSEDGRHGTHVAGLALHGNPNVEFVPVKGIGSFADTIKSLEYAIERGAKVLNMSFGFGKPEDVKAALEVIDKNPDVLFVLAAGNDGKPLGEGALSADKEIAANRRPNVAVIASSTEEGTRAPSPNYGAKYATHAIRGEDVLSSVPGGGYEFQSGTSMAAPSFTAAAGKMLTLDPGLKPAELLELMTEATTKDATWKDLVAAGGVVDADRALDLAAQSGLERRGLTDEEARKRLQAS